MAEEKKVGMFGKIESKEDALKTIKDCAVGFFFLAVLQSVIGYFIAPGLIIDGILYAALAAILLKWNSRVAAVLLLLLGTAAAISTMLNMLGITSSGGNNIILAIMIFWAAIRSVEAAFKLHGKYA
ncbi:MAG: hypothetical protein ACMUIP_11195 [bacterium]